MKSIYKLIFFCCFLTSAKLVSQQTVMYTQYGFNKAGINPAAAGTEINQGLFYTFGVNRPWSGIDNSPKQNFTNPAIKGGVTYKYNGRNSTSHRDSVADPQHSRTECRCHTATRQWCDNPDDCRPHID